MGDSVEGGAPGVEGSDLRCVLYRALAESLGLGRSGLCEKS